VAGRGGPPDLSEPELRALRHRAKAEIRKRVGAIRRALPTEARHARSAKIAARVTVLEPWSRATTVALYVAMRGEADPAPLAVAARENGKRVVLPRLEPGAELTWHLAEEGASLEESGMGFEQPATDAPAVHADAIDLVIVPAMAADDRGHRIGWGGGYYDRALPRMTHATRVAIVYDFQMLAEVPNTPNDVPVHYVVTDRGVRRGLLDSER